MMERRDSRVICAVGVVLCTQKLTEVSIKMAEEKKETEFPQSQWQHAAFFQPE